MKNIIGERFGRLTILEYSYTNKHKKRVYTCLCDCGNVKNIVYNSLSSGLTKSCGCLKKEKSQATGLKNKDSGKHNMSNTSTYRSYVDMKNRCYNKHSKKYYRYGGRGITVCDRWLESFENFLEDMGEKPNGLTLDRIDNNGNYEPNNYRWATITQQNINKEKSDMWGIRKEKNGKYSMRISRERLVKYSISTKDISFLISLRDSWVNEYNTDREKWIQRTLKKEYKRDME